ncbi:MAG: FMN-binding negative transcriptional regulator [Actinomycetota bacterium]
MLIRRHDDGTDDPERWRRFVVDQGFGHLVAAGTNRPVPVVVPTQFVLSGDAIVLHLARPNPIFECLAENDRCLVSVAGDWSYIPGAWKAVGDEDPRFGVPTTYYGAVQLSGRAIVLEDPDEVAATLRVQLDDLEPAGDLVDPSEHGAKLRAIRGLRIEIDEVRAKFKYGGNVDQAHRDHIAAQLEARDGPGDAAARRHMPQDQD